MAKTHKVRFDINHEELIELYVVHKYTLRQLQKRFHICGEHLRATLDYLLIDKHKPSDFRKDFNTGYDKNKSNYNDYEMYIRQQESQYRRGAKRRGVVYELSVSEFQSLVESDCHYCGVPPQMKHSFQRENDNIFCRNGIDRVDNNLGYISTNVVPCCHACNVAKNNMSKEDFLGLIERIYNHQRKEG